MGRRSRQQRRAEQRSIQERNTGFQPPSRQPSGNVEKVEFHQEIRTGPLPDPETLFRYGQALPDAPDRIIKIAEGQTHHRQQLERAVVYGNIAAQTRGQYIGGAIAVLALSYGSFLLYMGKDMAGFAVVGSVATSLAAIWVLGKIEQHKDLARKAGQAPAQVPEKQDS